jgi:antitoxin ChpS
LEKKMEVTLRKYGNSTVAVLPPNVVRDLRLSVGQQMTLSTQGGQILLAPKRTYRLSDMLAQCDLSAPPPRDLKAWDDSAPVGQEVW